jgi:hypothetical protein
MSTQPIALWLAEKLEDMPADGHWLTVNNAAAELRRLHEENAKLRGFAQEVRRTGDTRLASMAIAALAQGEKT